MTVQKLRESTGFTMGCRSMLNWMELEEDISSLKDILQSIRIPQEPRLFIMTKKGF